VLLLLAFLSNGTTARAEQIGPSFPCPAPSDPLANLICSDPSLSRVDLSFVQAYQALRQQLGNSGEKELRQEAVAFTEMVRSQCHVPPSDSVSTFVPLPGTKPCIDSEYMAQRRAWKSRLTGPAAEEAARPLELHITLQADLQGLGFLPANEPIDGVYGPATRRAILAWQFSIGRPVTGFLGDADAAALQVAVEEQQRNAVSSLLPPTSSKSGNWPPSWVQESQPNSSAPSGIAAIGPQAPAASTGEGNYGPILWLGLGAGVLGLFAFARRRASQRRVRGGAASKTADLVPVPSDDGYPRVSPAVGIRHLPRAEPATASGSTPKIVATPARVSETPTASRGIHSRPLASTSSTRRSRPSTSESDEPVEIFKPVSNNRIWVCPTCGNNNSAGRHCEVCSTIRKPS